MISRKQFSAAAAGLYAGIGIVRVPGEAAEFNYKLGHDDPPSLPASIRIASAVDKIKSESGGRIDIQIFPNDTLGSARDQLAQLRLGAIAFLRIGYADVAAAVPVCAMDWLPYIYTSYKQAFDARDGAFGAYLRGEMAKAGLYAFEKPWELGFRQIYNSAHPITTPDDLKGLKLRVVASTAQVAFFKGLGAAPTPMAITEVYPSLQTHLIDGGDLPLGPILSRKFYEVAKYLSITNHSATGILMLANASIFAQLPKNLRDVVSRNLNAAALADREDMQKAEAATEATLKDRGMIENHADVAAFKAGVKRAGLYAQWKADYGAEAWGALEKSVGPLT